MRLAEGLTLPVKCKCHKNNEKLLPKIIDLNAMSITIYVHRIISPNLLSLYNKRLML